jgi:iron complex outermembrane recepter protein
MNRRACVRFPAMTALLDLDLSVIWNLTRHVQVRAGVNNVFDKDPPFVPAEVSGGLIANTLPPYDILGRYIFLGLGATF